ncbi:MAG: M14 family metallopeptidase [Deltaproteobacteria bacterium]|nr:M14 family metallopeptidase [Myxococcales bacterium]MDP3217184.1 M14 family metallopeptidase [Deltaproteobacteria bacterium]
MHTSTDQVARLEGVSRGFRSRYLKQAELEAQLHAWAEAFPALVSLRSIGRSLDGRHLWVLVIGPEPERVRPTVWVDGNMHASEVCGSSVALAIAEDVIRLHLEGAIHRLSAPVCARLKEVLFHVMPRMSPDGAEAVLTDGRYVRSNPRDRRPNRQHARWVAGDVDGDGLAQLMRVRDPGGEYVDAPDFPGLLVPRTVDDEGPFFKVYPEGLIENFDGRHVPSPHFLSDNDTDLNRNFPWSWAAEPQQVGAGAYPTSEPECRAVVEHVTRHPEVFAWLNLHTFGGVFIRPPGHCPDAKMDAEDLAVFRQVGQWGEALTGYPMVSGFEDFLYEPEKPLHGDLTDFGYYQRGAISYVCELWDLFKQLGIARKKPFVDHYAQLTRDDLLALARWDETHNAGRIIRRWRSATHPQLGAVEIGGVDPRVGIWNPPYDVLGGICVQQAQAFLRVAAMAPALSIAHVEASPLEGDHTLVTVTVQNEGYLSTAGIPSAKKLPWNEPVSVEFRGEGVDVVGGGARRELGHLEGWGRGLYGGASLFFQRSRGNVGTRVVEQVVRGRGTLQVRVGACRVGWVEASVSVGSGGE